MNNNRTIDYVEKAREAYLNGEMNQNTLEFAARFQMNSASEKYFCSLICLALEFDLMSNEEGNSLRELVLDFKLRPAYEQVAVLSIMQGVMSQANALQQQLNEEETE